MYGFTPSSEEDYSDDEKEENDEKMPVLLTRNVNVSHLFVLDAVRRLYREKTRRDLFSIPRDEQKSFSSCDDDDDAAYAKESDTTSYGTTFSETLGIYDARKGTSSFRIRGKIRPKDRTPIYLEDARFLGYLRGVSQAYVDGFEKSVADDNDDDDEEYQNEKLQRHERFALQAADFMLKHPHRAAKNGLNASLDAEYLAVRSVPARFHPHRNINTSFICKTKNH